MADAQSGDAVEAQSLVDDGGGIGGGTHLGGADGVEDRGADIAGGLRQRRIVVADGRTGQIFLRLKFCQCLLLRTLQSRAKRRRRFRYDQLR